MNLERQAAVSGNSGAGSTVVRLHEFRGSCRECGIRRHCLLDQMCDNGPSAPGVERCGGYLRRGEFVYHQGAPFRSVYIVKSGCVMTYTTNTDGVEQVLGFHLPGEFFGLEGVHSGSYGSAAMALDQTHFCSFSMSQIEQLCSRNPAALHRLLGAFGSEMVKQNQAQVLRNQCETGQRLEDFILDYSDRLQRLGFAADDFKLSMSRYNIASYLGSAPETVSRKFTELQRAGMLNVTGRRVHIVDRERWRQRAGGRAQSVRQAAHLN